jgi:hypothetical protein
MPVPKQMKSVYPNVVIGFQDVLHRRTMIRNPSSKIKRYLVKYPQSLNIEFYLKITRSLKISGNLEAVRTA